MPPIPELEAIRKTQIIEAGLHAIARHGCANVTMDDICRAAGLSKGGVAHYYRSKKELFKAVFNTFFDQIFNRGRETMALYDDPIDQVLSFDWLYDADDPDLGIGYPLLFDFMAVSVHDRDYRKIFHDWIENWVGLLNGALEKGIQNGRFRDLDALATARTISAIYQGVATRWYLDPVSHSRRWALDSFQTAIRGLLAPYMSEKPTASQR